MQLKYGNYTHPSNEAFVVIRRTPTVDQLGQKDGYVERWDIGGELQAANQSALTTKISALVSAYSANGFDLVLYENAGGVSAHSMRSSESVGGTRVVEGPSFLEGRGAEYTTWRTYQIAVEAKFESALAYQLVSFMETLEFSGNGAGLFVHQPVLVGRWPRQDTSTHSVYRAVQRGEAVGRTIYPFAWVPAPLWPFDEQGSQRRTMLGPPEYIDGSYRNFRISWEYVFESNSPLFGLPTRR